MALPFSKSTVRWHKGELVWALHRGLNDMFSTAVSFFPKLHLVTY